MNFLHAHMVYNTEDRCHSKYELQTPRS